MSPDKRTRTFWRLSVEIDKMDWLRVNTRWEIVSEWWINSWKWILCLKPWDEIWTQDIVWKILDWDWNELWSGTILDKYTIDNEFRPFQEWSDVPTPYSKRPWSLWKPKTIWVFRIQSCDWKSFSFVRWDWWEAIKEVFLEWVSEPDVLKLVINVRWNVLSCVLFDKTIDVYRNRVDKLLKSSNIVQSKAA